jgi:hypothetical protein
MTDRRRRLRARTRQPILAEAAAEARETLRGQRLPPLPRVKRD